jgi:hypothetical protein
LEESIGLRGYFFSNAAKYSAMTFSLVGILPDSGTFQNQKEGLSFEKKKPFFF